MSNNYWGGDENGQFDGPVKGISIVTEKKHLINGRDDGLLYVDFLEGVLPAPLNLLRRRRKRRLTLSAGNGNWMAG